MAKHKEKHHQKSVSKPNPFETKSPKLGRADANHNHEAAATAKKKKNKLGPNAVAMKHQAPLKPNPFETIWSRRKFDILGKKRKGEERRVGLSRSRAIEKRKNTLLREYEQSNKASVFVDKRIGEHNDELNEFDKAIQRAQREHQLKTNKKGKYNLSDGEEDDFEFQSLGALSERDDFEDDVLPDDDDDGTETTQTKKRLAMTDQMDGDLMEGEENRPKSKKEVMKEVMAKDKYYRAERAKDKEELEDFRQELDKSFTSIVPSKLLQITEPDKNIPNEHSKKDELSEQEKSRSYFKTFGNLVMVSRAQPSDRTKTPEEIAQEEREQLEHLEEERQKRMLATDINSDDDNEDAETPSNHNKPRPISGDDLGDSFSLDEEPRIKKGWVDEILERKDASDSESEEGDASEDSESPEDDSEGSDKDINLGEKNLFMKDWEQSDDDNLGTDLDEEEEKEDGSEAHEEDDDADEEEVEPRKLKKMKKIDASEASKKEGDSLDAKKISQDGKRPSTQSDLPYLIEAPKSFEEFGALVDNLSNADIVLIINRIRKSNAIKLAAENRKKMQVFYGVLLQYFAILANRKPLNMELLNFLVKPLIEMSMETPYFAAICARERILRARTEFSETVKNPATLLMCEYLARSPIMSGRDTAVGSFLCSMLLSITKQSRKFCPEAVMFLTTLLMAAKDRKPMPSQNSHFCHLMELKAIRPLLCINESVGQVNPLNFLTIMDLPEDSSFFRSDDFRASVLVTVIETLREFVIVYEGFSSFPEIFLPISVLLLEVAEQDNIPQVLTDKLKDVAELIKTSR
ncbi:uncharacterized protein [Malus domestica]|uniref:uncharacterized protein isoform X2 n=1 Tax=Malus domestica TaxID=3750 RepID=UPI0039755433